VRNERLKSRKRIERVFRDGKSLSLFPFKVWWLLQPAPGEAPLQAGFGASSREAYRHQKQPLLQRLKETDRSMAIFFIYTGKDLPDYVAVTQKIGVALQKLIKEIS
jgi:ribonuclease P protein component